MLSFPLNNNHNFVIESYEKRFRLIVFKDGLELVCRKESSKNLAAFLSSSNGQIFKGRLQLIKENTIINIQVKGDVIGAISEMDFRNILQAK